MRYVILAADFDGTLARDGRVAATTVAALRRLAATDRKLILVTGRELEELLAIFPEIDAFDRRVPAVDPPTVSPGEALLWSRDGSELPLRIRMAESAVEK